MAEEASSLVGIVETTVELKSSVEKFHDLLVGRPHQVHPTFRALSCKKAKWAKLVPSLSGITFMTNGEAKVLKKRIESMEPENNRVTYRVLDGDLLKEYTNFVVTFQVTAKEGEPGSVAHWPFEYEKINEEVAHPETLLQLAVEVSKEMDEHLLSEE